MALFSFGKKGKKQQDQSSAPGSPAEQIMSMKQQGMDDNQIVQEMERQGYNSSQIFEAMNQLNVSGQSFQQQPQQQGGGMPPPPQQDYPYQQEPYGSEYEQGYEQQGGTSKEEVEELVEAIIEEKWKEFEEDVKKIIDWKDKTETRINQLEQQIKDLSSNLNSLHKNIINKVSEYDKNITDVGTEIKAMEKVFQKVLPSLTENVNKLERMAKGASPKTKKKSE